MSFSLSSLLNPEPKDTAQEVPAQRKESMPQAPVTESPRQEHPPLPQWQPPSTAPHRKSSAVDDEAARALASLAGSSASPPIRDNGFGRPPSAGQYNGRRASEAIATNGYNAPIELPRPSPSSGGTAAAVNTHSPTLESYHMTSRSPEAQRRGSVVSTSQTAYTLPPMQGLTSSQQPHLDAASHENVPSNFTPGARASPSAHLSTATSNVNGAADAPFFSPTAVKPEPTTTPLPSSPSEERRTSDQPAGEQQTTKTIASLKNEYGLRTQSPLRDSSVPLPSTEMSAPNPNPKKRSAPSKKKGTASSIKKAPASKKRKVEPKTEGTPSSRTSKPALKTGSSRGTPAGSSPAPSARSYSATANSADDEEMEEMDEERDGDNDLYCICKKPDTGTFMIGCDGTCDDWFHGKCVDIQERDKNLVDKFICPGCHKAGLGETTWKPMCRNSPCRHPARAGKKGVKASKYCSDACGVAYFANVTAKTEEAKEKARSRSSRRKNSTHQPSDTGESPAGARGGVLAPGEVKALLHASKTIDEFKKLGEGVLSPPATPEGKGDDKDNTIYQPEEAAALGEIATLRENARNRHLLLKDRMKFVNMIKQAATTAAAEKDLKPKDYCGYDSRLEWTEETFSNWLRSAHGKTAMELETLATENDGKTNGDTEMADANDENDDDDLNDYQVCDKKKCARHAEWTKVCVDHVREELSGNGDRMRWLEGEAAQITMGAAMRSKSNALGGEGSVEVHEDTEEDGAIAAKLKDTVSERGAGKATEVDGRPAMARSMDLPTRKLGSVERDDGVTSVSKSGSEVPEATATAPAVMAAGEGSGLDSPV